ncbi:MAG: hypothetical protein HC830_10140 [Bacteroidetes bacterium]|nr:hypothetical protein [Bacteroidota bacterium]
MMMIDTTITIHGKVGATYKLTLDQYGTTTNREVIDTTGSKFGGSNFDMSPKISSSGLFCEFPEKSIKTGDKWTKTTSDSISAAGLGGKMGFDVNTEYTLGAKEKIAGKEMQKITFTSTMEIGGKSKMQGMDFYIEGTGIVNGFMYIDPVSKVISESDTDTEMEMTMALTGQQAMTIPMSIKMKMTQKLK